MGPGAVVLLMQATRGRSLALPLLALLVATAIGCGDPPPRPPIRAPETPYQAVASEWFAVDEVELSTLDEERIGQVGFPPPALLTRHELEIPPGHPITSHGAVIVLEAIVGVGGRIAKARLLRGGERPELRESLVRCLRQWEYRPAVYQGEASAVTQVIIFNIRPGEARSRPPRREGP